MSDGDYTERQRLRTVVSASLVPLGGARHGGPFKALLILVAPSASLYQDRCGEHVVRSQNVFRSLPDVESKGPFKAIATGGRRYVFRACVANSLMERLTADLEGL